MIGYYTSTEHNKYGNRELSGTADNPPPPNWGFGVGFYIMVIMTVIFIMCTG